MTRTLHLQAKRPSHSRKTKIAYSHSRQQAASLRRAKNTKAMVIAMVCALLMFFVWALVISPKQEALYVEHLQMRKAN